MPDDQSGVIAFLADPVSHGVTRVERIDTHCAHVFLAGDTAWKMKRAVKYDYLDFSTLGKRKKILDRELSLNARAAPTLYRRVVPITREEDGALAIDGAGEPVEYALEMRRFPGAAQLDRIAEAGQLDDALARDLGVAVADYHDTAEVLTADGADLIREIIEELGRVFAGMHDDLGTEGIETFDEKATDHVARTAPLLTRRTAEGRVRRCHSDLHLANLVLLDGAPVPFDALEFDERLGTCDTFYDLAFLLMDLHHRGLTRQANLCLNAYLIRTQDHAALAALPLFLAVRSAIRAMVDVQTARATGSGALLPEAREYLTEAIAHLSPPPPRLVAIGGVSGTGKTRVARDLAPDLPPAPGAVHLRSDEIRKIRLGRDPLDPLPEAAYGPEVSEQVYRSMIDTARTCLAAGHSVILDATWLDREDRGLVDAVRGEIDASVTALWLTAPRETLLARVSARTGDASDADAAVVLKQLSRAPGAVGWTTIDASGTPEETLAAVRAFIWSA